MQLTYTEDPGLGDDIHAEDLTYMLNHTYTGTSFFLQTITHDSTTFTFWGDVQKNVYFVSDNMRERFGFPRNRVEDLVRVWMDRIYNPIDQGRYKAELKKVFSGEEPIFDMRYQVTDCNDNIFWVHVYGEVKWDEAHKTPLFFCGKITEQDRKLMTDPLTNFACEAVLINHLKSLHEKKCCCIGFSLNEVDRINSVRGRSCGDQLLRSIAADLVANCPPQLPFYRLDGMLFVAVVSEVLTDPVDEYVERIRDIIDKNYQSMDIATGKSCSFALMRYPKPSMKAEDFLEQLKVLVRLSRHEGSGLYLEDTNAMMERLQLQASMEMALSQDVMNDMEHFRTVVQPVVSAETGEIIGGETLMRWRYEGEDVSPGFFIPLLEKSGLIASAGTWVLDRAVQICKKAVALKPDFYLTVNVSLQQLYDASFPDKIRETLEKYDLAGEHLVVEMTESCMDQNPEQIIRLFEVCAQCGIRIALDDFGTGYSSMRVLLKYPLNIVKIDRTLLLEMSESQEKYNFISSIVFACHQFGKAVCIEGAEDEKQCQLSCYAGCDMIQGFYYYRPLELCQLFEILAS